MSDLDLPLELSHAGPALLEGELEPWAWSSDPGSPSDDELVCEGFAIPDPDAAGEVPTQAWNLDTGPSRAASLAGALALVPLLLAAEPSHAAPPTEAEASSLPIVGTRSEGPQPASDETTGVWQALEGRRVILTNADGHVIRATVLGVDQGRLVCARDPDGLMTLVDIDTIASVTLVGLPGTPTPRAAQNGEGMIVFGAIATTIGGVFGIASLTFAATCLDASADSEYGSYWCPYYTLPFGVTGTVNLAVGIPILALGLRKRREHRQALREAPAPVIAPTLATSRTGGVLGLNLRF